MSAASDPVAVALQQAVIELNLAGGIAVVADREGARRFSAGSEGAVNQVGFVPHTHIRAASITKVFVAATILQLVGEGRIGLDEPVDRYLPGRIRGDGIDGRLITVRELLRHQSGLPDYLDENTARTAPPTTAGALLDQAFQRTAEFVPGSDMKYSNTNYVVAGMLVEAVTGVPAEVEVTRRIIAPLALPSTYFPAPGDKGLREPYAHGYQLGDAGREDVTLLEPSVESTAGALVSSNEDLATFLAALLDGRVLAPALLSQMTDTVAWPDYGPAFRYGLGLVEMSLPCGVTVWGHAGGVPGFQSLVVGTPGERTLSLTFTQSPLAANLNEDPRAALAAAAFCSPRP